MDPISTVAWIGLTGIVFSFLSNVVAKLIQKAHTPEQTETLEDRVERLTKSLNEATSLISNIEGEIKARSSLATQLQEDVERYNKLSELKKPEVEAIAQVLRGELAQEGRKSFWKGFGLNFLFFVLGAIASYGINLITK